MPDTIKADMKQFIENMAFEDVDHKQNGIRDKAKESILEELKAIYG